MRGKKRRPMYEFGVLRKLSSPSALPTSPSPRLYLRKKVQYTSNEKQQQITAFVNIKHSKPARCFCCLADWRKALCPILVFKSQLTPLSRYKLENKLPKTSVAYKPIQTIESQAITDSHPPS